MSSAAAPWANPVTFYRNQIVPLRWALALFVVWMHSFNLLGRAAEEPFWRGNGFTLSLGDFAVNGFLTLSGFLVAHSLASSDSVWHFLLKRIRRIYPAFLALSIVTAVVFVPLATVQPITGYSVPQIFLLIYDAFDLHGYGYPYGGLYPVFASNPLPLELNGSLWTIRYEFICYLALGAASGLKSQKVWRGLLLAALVWSASGWLPPWHFVATALLGNVNPWPRLLAHFLVGVLFYQNRESIPFRASWALGATALLVGAFFAGRPAVAFTLPLCGGYLLLWLAYHPVWADRFTLPDYSYGLYLYSFPLQQLIIHRWGRVSGLAPFKLFILSAAVSIVAGAASWYLIERRWLSGKSRSLHQ